MSDKETIGFYIIIFGIVSIFGFAVFKGNDKAIANSKELAMVGVAALAGFVKHESKQNNKE